VSDLSPEHARVLREVQQSLNDTIGPFREEVRVGLAVHAERLDNLAQRIDRNDETTQRVGLKVDELAERTASLEAQETREKRSDERKASAAKVGLLTALTGAVSAAGAYFTGWFEK